jgi:hypothetical protein
MALDGTPTWDGCDAALLGFLVCPDGIERAVYDYDALVGVFQGEDVSTDEAMEWVDFNIVGAYIGPQTPLIVDWRWPGDLFHANEHGA